MRSVRRRNHSIEQLESRRLLAGAGVTVLARFDAVADQRTSLVESVQVGNRMFLSADPNGGNEKLWVANVGTQTPTLLLTASHSYSNSALNGSRQGISQLTAMNGKVYFFANANGGDRLYVTDGTVAGTSIVATIRSGSNNILPTAPFVLNNKLYYFYSTAMWSSDGTAAGTVQVGTGYGGVRSTSPVINGNVFFGSGSGKLYRTDGTAAGTSLLLSPSFGTFSYPSNFVTANNKLFFNFTTANASLYSANLDGSNAGPITLPSSTNELMYAIAGRPLVVVNDRVMFSAVGAQSSIEQIMSSDGTAAGTVQIGGSTSASIRIGLSYLAKADPNHVVFVADAPSDASTGLFSTDGTVGGTQRISPDRISLTLPYSANGFAFIPTSGSNNDFYRTDGSASGTKIMRYLPVGITTGSTFLGERSGGFMLSGSENGLVTDVLLFNPTIATGSFSGQTRFDLNQNGLRESFEDANGFVYLDANGNGVFDAGDPSKSVSWSTAYTFDNYVVDTYTLRMTNDADITTPASKSYTVALQADDSITGRDFVKNPTPVAWGCVYRDSNGNGQIDAGETGISSQPVYIDYNNNQLPDAGEPTATSAADGTYGFVQPQVGTFPVRLVRTAGVIQTVPANRAGLSVSISASGISQVGDFANAAKAPGTITGAVWNDWNHDGHRDADDTPLANLSVYIDLNNDGVRSAAEDLATTSATGRYTFSSQVPGQYFVRAALTGSQLQTSPTSGAPQSVDIVSNSTTTIDDFLIYDPSVSPPAGRIAGSVWSDANSNGVHDSGEVSAIGVNVFLDVDGNGLFSGFDRVSFTDADGAFHFSNTPGGQYKIYVSLPPGWSQTNPTSSAYQLATLSEGQQLQLAERGVHSTDATAPSVASKSVDAEDHARVDFTFAELVGLTSSNNVVHVIDVRSGDEVSQASMQVSASAARVSITFPGLPGQRLAAGVYLATIVGGTVRDYSGNVQQADTTFSFVVVGNGETLQLSAGGGPLQVESISLAPTGQFDVVDNDLIVTGTSKSTIEFYIRTAYNFGDWQGAGGIFSSTAANNSNGNTTLGVLSGQEFNDNNGGTFDGQVVNSTDVLVKYTYFGDVDFNGAVEVSDYNLIDFGFSNHLTGWGFGDVDYSGAVDVSDYNLIDFAFSTQGGAL